MKKTLKVQLEEKEAEIKYWRERSEKFEDKNTEFEKKREDNILHIKQERDRAFDFNRTLLEIIRWNINPETAKYPFNPEKNQRDERNRGLNY